MKAGQVAEFFAGLDPQMDVLWQSFSREQVEATYGEALSDDLWEMVVELYDKEPATYEDFQVDSLIEIAQERLED